jgi:hypothetical protein
MPRGLARFAIVVLALVAVGAFPMLALAQGPWGGYGYGPMGPGMMGGYYGGPMGPGMMGGYYGGPMGPGMMGGWGYGNPGPPAYGTPPPAQSQLTVDQAKQLAQQYADAYLKGFTVDKVLPFNMPMGTAYSVELKGPKDEVRILHVNPWGNVMPFGAVGG